MPNCSECKKPLDEKLSLVCPNCGATVCSDCAKKNKKICSYCYSDLDYID